MRENISSLKRHCIHITFPVFIRYFRSSKSNVVQLLKNLLNYFICVFCNDNRRSKKVREREGKCYLLSNSLPCQEVKRNRSTSGEYTISGAVREYQFLRNKVQMYCIIHLCRFTFSLRLLANTDRTSL